MTRKSEIKSGIQQRNKLVRVAKEMMEFYKQGQMGRRDILLFERELRETLSSYDPFWKVWNVEIRGKEEESK